MLKLALLLILVVTTTKKTLANNGTHLVQTENAFYESVIAVDIHFNTGLPTQLCPSFPPVEVADGGRFVCTRGWNNRLEDGLGTCDFPDMRRFSPCVDVIFRQFRIYDQRRNFGGLFCYRKGLVCLGTLVIPGNTQVLSARQNLLSDGAELKETLSYLADLVAIDASSNNFILLSRNTFAYNPKLQMVNFDLNFLIDIPDDTFYGCPVLKSVSFAGNKLDYIPWNLFSENKQLKEVRFERNNISMLPPELFSTNEALECVKISHNSLSVISRDIFRHNHLLRLLDFSQNEISSLDFGIFQNLTLLKAVDLSFNMIRFLPRALFGDCESLEVLNLANNNIGTLESGWLVNNVNLKRLDLNGNPLTSAFRTTIPSIPGFTLFGLGENPQRKKAFSSWPWYQYRYVISPKNGDQNVTIVQISDRQILGARNPDTARIFNDFSWNGE